MFPNKKERSLKRLHFLVVAVLLSINVIFAQRVVMHTLTNFELNSTTNKFSFDIYSQSIGTQSIRVGLTSYYINFNNAALNNPVLSNINPKYTSGSPTRDYSEMTVLTALGKIAVTIAFTGNGDGIGDVLSTASSNGEIIATVTLDITDQNSTSMLSWDEINSAMNTPTNQIVINNFQGSSDINLPVELSTFSAGINQNKIELTWQTKTEVNNYGFDIERKINEGEWLNIGFVKGSGTTTELNEYSYSDKDIYSRGNKFQYRLKQIDNDGSFEYSDIVEVKLIPSQFELSQNYPNPFNPSTTISFSLPQETQLKITIYNMLGELVDTLVDGTYQAGYHKINFDASNLSSGAYIYRIESNKFTQIKKMMLLR
jgi:hypothetical protein